MDNVGQLEPLITGPNAHLQPRVAPNSARSRVNYNISQQTLGTQWGGLDQLKFQQHPVTSCPRWRRCNVVHRLWRTSMHVDREIRVQGIDLNLAICFPLFTELGWTGWNFTASSCLKKTNQIFCTELDEYYITFSSVVSTISIETFTESRYFDPCKCQHSQQGSQVCISLLRS